jgi:A/G-specific adenine glycosylase
VATTRGSARRPEPLPAPAEDAGAAPLRQALLDWYDAQGRDLPWRRSRDAYAIWVSEVMLQQTQVNVVLKYWAPFLVRFPTLQALAEAPLDAVLSSWRGLGYYARARNLHRAARAVVTLHAGRLPPSAPALAALPGFGRYTVGAVASIAFGLPEPVVDGNVARVLSRLYAVEGPPGEPARERALWAHAGRLVLGERPGDFNQAVMELGATLCRVAHPLCHLCPVRTHCRALLQGKVNVLPPPRVGPPRRSLRLAVAVARRRGRVLLGRRPARGLFGGLWELPSVELADAAEAPQARKALLALLGPGTRVAGPLAEVHRTLTHRALRLSLFEVQAKARPRKGEYVQLRWVTSVQAQRLGISSAMQAALRAAGGPGSALPAQLRRRAPSRRRRLRLQ